MFIGLSFIGILPKYIIECLHQIRCYYNGDIYLIIDDYDSQYLSVILKYDVKIVRYDNLLGDIENFVTVVNENINKFLIIDELNDRKLLFIRTFERFFLIHSIMKKYDLTDCFFMEIDNLIYDNPLTWVNEFKKKELCFMFNNIDNYSSGIMFIKTYQSINDFLSYLLNYISTSNDFMSEMICLQRYYQLNKYDVYLLPIYWYDSGISCEAYINYGAYGDSIFDAAAIGIFLLGEDAYHNNGTVVCGKKNPHSQIDYTKNVFEWKTVNNFKKPFIWKGDGWVLINNLHVHSKELHNGLSVPLP
jgi:hypothetical protein